MSAKAGKVLALVAALVLIGGCEPSEADPFGGCNQHPGQCGKTK